MDEPSAVSQQESTAGERLDSWKEIASYLKRSVRSAKRWEKEEKLPVHRHHHDKRDTVYAYRFELDGWWESRGAGLSDQNGAEEIAPVSEGPAKEASPPRKTSRTTALLAVSLFVILVIAVVWVSRRASRTASGGAPLAFQTRDWVLVADFENRTGEPLLDGTLEYALAGELSNSRHVNVVPRERIGDALRLMRKPLDTRVDAVVGREVCLRDGEIRTLLTGRIEKLGTKYLLSVDLVDPKRSTRVIRFTEESVGKEGALTAVRQISDRVRETLGETLPSESSETPLVRVTTSNLRALQLFSQADSLIARGNQAAAEELLRQAVAEDPNFASAYMHLAWAIFNQARPPEDWRPAAERAFELSAGASERERLFIRGSYYSLISDREKAIAAYEALVSIDPDHGWALHNLASLYVHNLSESELPRGLQMAVPLVARRADLRPKDFAANWAAAYFLVVWSRDPTRAAPYLRRASDLTTPELVAERGGWETSWMNILPFTTVWLQGDVAKAAGELDRVATKVDSLTGEAREFFAVMIAQGYLTLGKIEAAERASEKIIIPVARNDTLAELSFLKGDTLAMRKRLQLPGHPAEGEFPMFWEPIAMLQAREGFMSEAGRFHDAFEQKNLRRLTPRDRPELHEIPGEMALAKGDLARAISEFEKATTLVGDLGGNGSGLQLSFESLATALRKNGEVPGAIQVLERASERKYQAVIDGATGAHWMRNRLELARLYRSVGRVEEARVVEADLLKLLALADADHPILVELRRLQKS